MTLIYFGSFVSEFRGYVQKLAQADMDASLLAGVVAGVAMFWLRPDCALPPITRRQARSEYSPALMEPFPVRLREKFPRWEFRPNRKNVVVETPEG